MWPDIELAVMKALRPLLPGVRVTDEVPAKVETLLPVVTVQLGPGADDRITDIVTIDVQAFAADRGAMWRLAEQVRAAMLSLSATYAGGLPIDTVDTDQRPVEIPYGNPGLRRAVATYRLTTRGRTGA
ncbi:MULTISPECIES: hypothetical protein [unclassified Streptomyces]|uniref:phage tail termination protein n=1 Tax=unclassified Streptomyces TaxID=2593676 RepID=UPI000805E317|nr:MULTISPECIES: hypothetical protein [unclassified Streptomyces]MYR76534.1 hypothetical protein [Streptomyces sp. SID4925]SBV00004.1 hypothetical protein YUMDRAFT_06301 [Streptomyces sp. OspMP-M45]